MLPGQGVVFEVGAHHGGEEPGADDLVRLRPQVHREDALEDLLALLPAGRHLRAQRRGGPGVHDVGIADEAARLAALSLLESGRRFGGGIHRQVLFAGHDRVLVIDPAVCAERIPDREGNPEEALAAHAPVGVEPAHPGVVALAHVGGMPAQLRAAGQELVAVLDRADEPLAAGDDLERPVALLVELHRVADRARLAEQVARFLQQLHDPLAGALGPAPGQAGIGLPRPLRVLRLPARLAPAHREQPPVAADDRPHRQLQLPPPEHVGDVAEGADHGDAGALLRVGQLVRMDRQANAEERRDRLAAEERPVALVARVGDQGDAGRDQLGAGGVDLDAALGMAEADAVVGAADLAILDLGLGHRRVVVDVPEGGRLHLVGEIPGQQAQEGALRHPPRHLADGGVGQRPVDRQPEPAPEILEGLLVDLGQLEAEVDEVAARHREQLPARLLRRLELGVVGEARIAAHAVVVLHPALGGQAVVVPAHRIEDLAAAHALEAGHEVGVGVGEDVADVERAAHGGRRGVDRVDLTPRRFAVEAVGAVVLPALAPLHLQPLEAGLLRDLRLGSPLAHLGARGCGGEAV